MIKIGVTITSINNSGKLEQNYIETDNLLGATRIMLTFKPKRGYRVIEHRIEEVGVLV
jgi:hypothetical protein